MTTYTTEDCQHCHFDVCECSGSRRYRVGRMNVPIDIRSPVDWTDADLDPTGWRFHVPGEVRRQWDQLGSETKTTVAYMAQQSAEREGARKIIKKGKLAGGLDK